MSWALLALVAAVEPAALEDVSRWEKAGRALLDGPDACVEFEGTARVRIVLFTPGGWLGPGEQRTLEAAGPFRGRLDHGTWTSLSADLANADPKDEVRMDRLHPLVGKPPAGPPGDNSVSIGMDAEGTSVALASGGGQALNLVDRLVEEIDPAITTAYTLPEGEAVVLYQQVPLDDSRSPPEMTVRTTFPGGGAPTAIDVVFPSRVSVGDGPVKARLLNAQLHIRGISTPLGTLPGEEGASLVVGVLGFTLGVEQRLSYERARACPGP